MQKKSALTAALSGKPEPSAPAVPKSGYSDGFSFPCLSNRTEAAADESSDRFDELAVHSKLLAGSAPVAVHLANGSLAVSTFTSHHLCFYCTRSRIVDIENKGFTHPTFPSGDKSTNNLQIMTRHSNMHCVSTCVVLCG